MRRRPQRHCSLSRHSGHLSADRRGVEGFSEEIVAFVVVVIAVGAFITSAYTSYLSFERQQAASALGDDCYGFCRALRGHDAVMERGVIFQEPLPGRLDSRKLDALNMSVLQDGLNIRHHLNLTITDRASQMQWRLGEKPPAGNVGKSVVRMPVLIGWPDGSRNPGSIEAVMWD